MTESFELSLSGGVVHARLDRPDALNTLLRTLWKEVRELVTDIEATPSARVLVISSTGKHFSAGLDLSILEGGLFDTDAVQEPGRRRAVAYAGLRDLNLAFAELERVRVPVIAAVQGGCIGGAVSLVAACDLRYATKDAFFSLGETNLGITPDLGHLDRLPRLMPEGIAREMAYRGTRLGAERAFDVGFVNGVHDDHESLVAGALEVAAEIAAKSPLAVWGAKQAVTYARDHSVADGMERISLWQAAMYHRTDSVESAAAKQEGRPPVYDDLPPGRL